MKSSRNRDTQILMIITVKGPEGMGIGCTDDTQPITAWVIVLLPSAVWASRWQSIGNYKLKLNHKGAKPVNYNSAPN